MILSSNAIKIRSVATFKWRIKDNNKLSLNYGVFIVKSKRLNWNKYNWRDFEKICFEYAENKYEAPVYKVFLTESQKDGGKDIVIENTVTNKVAWGECKHHKNSVNLDQIGKNVILSITNNVHKLIFFSVSPITPNTKCEIIRAARMHGFTVSFLDGNKLDEEIGQNKRLLNKYFKEVNLLNQRRENNIEIDVYIDEYQNAYNDVLYSNKKYWKIKKGLSFYIHIFIKNWFNCPIIVDDIIVEESNEIHIEPFEKKSICIDAYCDTEITISGLLFNTQTTTLLPNISLVYTFKKTRSVFTTSLGEIDGTDIWEIPMCGELQQTFLSKKVPQLITDNKENKPNVVLLQGCSGCGKTRLMEESSDKLRKKGIDTIYINAQIFKKTAFYKELLRQVLCVPVLETTDSLSYEVFQIFLKKAHFVYRDYAKLYNFFWNGKKLTAIELTELLYSCVLKVSFNQNLCVQIDNIQELNSSTQESIVLLCEKLKENKVPVLLFLSYNTSVHTTQKNNPLLSYLKHETINSNGTFFCSTTLGELDDNSALFMVQQLLNLEPCVSKEANTIIEKTGKLPLDILLFCKLLSESNCFSRTNNYSRIINPKEFRNNLDTLSNEMSTILQTRLDSIITKNNKEQLEIKKICQLVVFFENRLPINVFETFRFSRSSLSILEKALIAAENAFGEISFFHDNYYRYFLEKEDYSIFSKNDFIKISKFIKRMEPIYGKQMMVKYAKCLFYLGKIEDFLELSEKLLNELPDEGVPYEFNSLAEFYINHINGELYKNQRLRFMIELAYTRMELQSLEYGINTFREIENKLHNCFFKYDSKLVCKFYHHYVNTYLHSGYYYDALNALDRFEKMDYLSQYYKTIIDDRYCIAYSALGDFNSANVHIDSAIKNANEMKNNFLLSTVYSDKAFNYLRNTNLSLDAAKYFGKAIQYYFPEDDTTSYRKIEIYIQDALMHLLYRDYKESYNSIEKALTLSQKRSYTYLLLPAQNIKAFLCMKEKQFENSLELLQENLFNAEIFGSERKVIVANNSMGILYSIRGEHNTAMQYFKTAWDISIQLCSNGGGIAQVLPIAFNIINCSQKCRITSNYPQLPEKLIEQLPADRKKLYRQVLNREIKASDCASHFSLTIADYIYLY